MKKKLRLYCGLLAVVLVAAIVCNNFELYVPTNNEGEELFFGELPKDYEYSEITENDTLTYPKKREGFNVKVYPWYRMCDNRYLLCKVGGQTCRVDIREISLQMPWNRMVHFKPYIVSVVTRIPIWLLFAWLLVIVFQVLRSVKRSEVFVARIAKKLEWAGILLVVIQLLSFARTCIVAHTCEQYIKIMNHDIYWKLGDVTYFVIGLALMILSQIILMGKELQEEQELTI